MESAREVSQLHKADKNKIRGYIEKTYIRDLEHASSSVASNEGAVLGKRNLAWVQHSMNTRHTRSTNEFIQLLGTSYNLLFSGRPKELSMQYLEGREGRQVLLTRCPFLCDGVALTRNELLAGRHKFVVTADESGRYWRERTARNLPKGGRRGIAN